MPAPIQMDVQVLLVDDLLDQLREAIGAANVLHGVGLEPYRHDATFLDAEPRAAVLPGTTEEVAAIVRVCAAAGLPLVPRGAGSSLVGGSVPLGGGVVISMERFNQLEIDPSNLCAVAGAGVITAKLNAAAAEHGLMYPPDPASVEICSIGGNVACNSGGMHSVKYGVTADYVIGLTVVMADGRIQRLGGRLRKRAAGYRLMQLFVGSEGTLGIITEVIVRLVPMPAAYATAVVGFRSLDDAAAGVTRLFRSGHLPAALELIDRSALDLMKEHLPQANEPGLSSVLIVEQDGIDEDHVLAQMLRMVQALEGCADWIAQSPAERFKIWSARRKLGHILTERPDNFFAEDIGVPIGAIPEMAKRLSKLSAATGLTIALFGHAGDGNLHPTILFSDAQRSMVGGAAARILRDALELGGTISAEHGLGALKRDFAEEELGSEAMDLMRRIKSLLDPRGILNPHKVFPEQPANEHFLDAQPGWVQPAGNGVRRHSELGG
jgi:glycolate oxidase